MSKHLPGVVWSLRGISYGAYVRTNDEDSLFVQVVDPDTVTKWSFWISRRDARLLAKRLNQCLDETRGRS